MVATRLLDCKQQATVAVICLASDNCERKGERTDRWLGLARPTIKYNPSLLYKNSFCLGKQGFCVGSRRRDKGCKSPEMVCKTRIVFSDEYSAMDIPNRATANETRSLYCTERSVLGISILALLSKKPPLYGFLVLKPGSCDNLMGNFLRSGDRLLVSVPIYLANIL
jgi:hypothetical protein